jgi:hypothetical protein
MDNAILADIQSSQLGLGLIQHLFLIAATGDFKPATVPAVAVHSDL